MESSICRAFGKEKRISLHELLARSGFERDILFVFYLANSTGSNLRRIFGSFSMVV